MASTREPKFVSGVWGPYYSAMVPSLYLNEGGQSAAGALIDHVIESHAAFTELKGAAEAHGESNVAFLNRRLSDLAKQQGKAVAMLAADLHVTPDYAGNRSPLADPRMRGVIVGLGLTATMTSQSNTLQRSRLLPIKRGPSSKHLHTTTRPLRQSLRAVAFRRIPSSCKRTPTC